MKTKFTKGEWEIFGDWGIRAKRSERQLADNNCHATFEYDRGGSDEGFANAHLIAAAPDMYAFIDSLIDSGLVYGDDVDTAQELLAKARGEQ